MRISSNEDDPGYATWMAMPKQTEVRIFLNDVKQRGVVIADDIEGFIVRCVYDEDGYLVADWTKDEIVHETVYGKVRIELPA